MAQAEQLNKLVCKLARCMKNEYYMTYENYLETLAGMEIYNAFHSQIFEQFWEISKHIMDKYGGDFCDIVNSSRQKVSTDLTGSLVRREGYAIKEVQSKKAEIKQSLSNYLNTDSEAFAFDLANELRNLSGQNWGFSGFGTYFVIKNMDTGVEFALTSKDEWYLGTLANTKSILETYHPQTVNTTNSLTRQSKGIHVLNLPILSEDERYIENYTDMVMCLKDIAPTSRNEVKEYLTTPNPLYNEIPELAEAVKNVAFAPALVNVQETHEIIVKQPQEHEEIFYRESQQEHE